MRSVYHPPSRSCVSTIEWMHHQDTKEILEEKIRWNYTKMLHAVLNRSWKQMYGHLPPISQTNQVWWIRHVREAIQSHKRCSLIDSYTWTCQFWRTSKDLCTSALCRHWMQCRGPARSYG